MATMKNMVATNADLMLEVISWLPIRSVLRFKSVCKLWHSVISDPYFIFTHTCRRDQQHAVSEIIFTVGAYSSYSSLNVDDELITYPLRDPNFSNMLEQTMSITRAPSEICAINVSYWDGLLLYRLNVLSDRSSFYYLYNFITMDFKQIHMPEPGLNFPLPYPQSMLLISDNCVLMLNYVSLEDYTTRCHVSLYSFKIGKWENCGKPFIHQGRFLDKPGVFWNGSANWISVLTDSDNLVIMSFNIKSYKWREIQVSDRDGRSQLYPLYFGESRDHLHVIVSEDYPSLVCDILELAEDFSKWSTLYHLNFYNLGFEYDGIIEENWETILYDDYFWSLNMFRGKRREDDKLFFNSWDKFLSYNLMNEALHENIVSNAPGLTVSNVPRITHRLFRFYDLFIYKPTLTFP